MSHFDSSQLTLIWLAHIITLNYWQPTDSRARWKPSFIFTLFSVTYYISLHVGAKRLVFHLSPRDGHVIFFSRCLIWQLPIHPHTDCLQNGQDSVNLWHLTSAYMQCVYGRVGVRYVITKFSCLHRFQVSLSNGASLRTFKESDLN